MILSKFDYDWKPIVFPKEIFYGNFQLFMKHVLKELNKYGEYGWKCNEPISTFERKFQQHSQVVGTTIEICYLFVRENIENIDDLIQTVHHNACISQIEICIKHFKIDNPNCTYPCLAELNIKKKK